MAINPITLYPSYVYTKPSQKPKTVNYVFGNNQTKISPELQADIVDIKVKCEKIVNPLEKLGTGVNNLDLKVNKNRFTPVFSSLTTKNIETDNDFGKTKLVLGALSPLPSFRRVMSVPDSIHDENWGRAAGTAGLAALYLPADIRDSLKLGMAEISSIKNRTGPIKVQINQNFLGGTLLNEWRHKNQWLNKILRYVDKYDKTVSETNFGKFIQDKFKIVSQRSSFKTEAMNIYGRSFEGNIFRRTAGCTLKRIPIIGLALSSLFEIPALYKAATVEGDASTKAKSFTKQLYKSGSFIGLNTVAIAVAGGLAMAAGMGVLASLALSAVGAGLALWGSNKLNKQIDKLFA